MAQVVAGVAGVAALAAIAAGLAAESPRLALVGFGVVATVLLSILRPGAAVLAVAAIIYSNAAVVAVNFHGAPGIAAVAVPLLLVIPALSQVVRHSVVLTTTMPWLLALLLVQMVSALLSRNISDSMESIISFGLEGLLLFILVVNSVRDHELLRRIIWVLVLTGAALGALSGFQQLTGTYYTRYLGFAQVGDGAVLTETAAGQAVTQPRLAGPIGEKNYYAQYLLMLVPLGGYLIVSERRRLLRAGAAIATGLALVGISLTFSRGAAVGLAVVVLALGLLGYIRLRQLAIGAVAIGLLLVLAPDYVARVTRITDVVTTGGEVDEAVAGRLGENTAAMLAFFDHPVAGVGPGQFRLYYEGYARELGADQHTGIRRAHSLYLNTAAELGVVGAIAMLGVLGSTIRALWRSRRHWLATHPDRAQLPIAFLLSLISFLATAAFLDLAYARYFWFMLGLAAAAAHIASSSLARLDEPSPRLAGRARPGQRWHIP